MTKLGLSVEEAAEAVGVGRTTICALIRTGEIESVKIGRRRIVPRDAVEVYMQRLVSEKAAGTQA